MVRAVRDGRLLPAAVSLAVAAFLLVPLLLAPPRSAEAQAADPCADPPISDFADRNEAYEVHRRSIDCVDHTDISHGAAGGRLFRPLLEVTRGQMATFIIQTLQAAGLGDRLPNGDPPDEFSDIAEDTHRTAINQLARINVVRGTGSGQYAPRSYVRRDQMASFLLQAAEWAYNTDFATANSYFGDVSPANPHHGNINAAYEQGLVRGTREPESGQPRSGTFTIASSVLRQTMASFLTNELRAVVGASEPVCASPMPSSSATATPTATASASTSPSPATSATPTATTSPSPSSSAAPLLPQMVSSASPQPSPSASASASASPAAMRKAALAAAATTDPDGSPTPAASSSPCPEPSGSATASTSPTASASASASTSPPASPSSSSVPLAP